MFRIIIVFHEFEVFLSLGFRVLFQMTLLFCYISWKFNFNYTAVVFFCFADSLLRKEWNARFLF